MGNFYSSSNSSKATVTVDFDRNSDSACTERTLEERPRPSATRPGTATEPTGRLDNRQSMFTQEKIYFSM